MIIVFKESGIIYSINGYRNNYTEEMIDELKPLEGYRSIRIYDHETIDRVWLALDTGGTIKVELNENDEPIGIITENGELEPIEEVTPALRLTSTEQLGIELSQREINEIIQGRQIADLEIRLLMGGL